MSVDVEAMIAARGVETLSHAGVKGMRWGVRRSDEQLSNARAERNASQSSSSGGLGAKGFKSGQSDTPGGGGAGDPNEEVQWDDLDDEEKEAWLEATLGSKEKLDFKTWVFNRRLKQGNTVDSKGNKVAPMKRDVQSKTQSFGPDLKSAVDNIAKSVGKTVDEVSEAVGGLFSDLVKKLSHGDISPDEAGHMLLTISHGSLSFEEADSLLAHGTLVYNKERTQSLIVNMQSSDILAHYGIKGMRWGVRRSERELAKAQAAVDSLVARRGSESAGVTVKGGRVHSSDSATASDLKSIAKSYGSSALSNQDLQALNTRMNLERTYAQLNPKEKTRLQKTLDGVAKTAQINKKLGNPAGKAAKALIDKKTGGSATKAATAARTAGAAAAAAGSKAPKVKKEKSSSNILSTLPTAGSNLDFTLRDFDPPATSTLGTEVERDW